MTDEAKDAEIPSVGTKVVIAIAAVLFVLASIMLDFAVWSGVVALGWYVLHGAGLVGPVYFNGVLALGLCTWVLLYIIKSVVLGGTYKDEDEE